MIYKGSLMRCITAAVHCLETGATREIVIVAAELAKYYKLYDIAGFKADEERLIRMNHRILFHGSGGELRQFVLNSQLNLWKETLDDEQKTDLPPG